MRKHILLVSIALVLLSACSGVVSNARFDAGIYTGIAPGYGGDIIVEVETGSRDIRSIRILKHDETSGISSPAFEQIPAEILRRQHLAVDAVAGCTLTSNAIILAVSDALSKSAADISAISPAWAEDTPAMAHTLTYEADVVIVGAGGAGLTAGVEALRAGSSVIILEKQPSPGGNTLTAHASYPLPGSQGQYDLKMCQSERDAISRMLSLAPRDEAMRQWQSDLGREYEIYLSGGNDYLFDSRSLFKLLTYVSSGYRTDTELLEVYAGGLEGGAKFLEDLAASWKNGVYSGVGSGWRRSLVPSDDWGPLGASFVMPQLDAVKKLGGQLLYNMTAQELILTDGRVTGVRGSAQGVAFEVTAHRGVILATGGYSANKDMISSNEINNTLPISGTSSVTGDGIVMGINAGAAAVAGEVMLYPLYGGGITTRAVDSLILLDSEGRRFVREDASQNEISSAILSAGGWAWALTDAISSSGRTAELLVGRGALIRADSISELAQRMQIPAEILEETILQFNEAAKGESDPLGRAVFDRPFGQAPLYACRVSPAISGSGGGLKIDAEARVLNESGQPIPGLWAAGEVAGGLSGIAGPNAVIFGRIAGRNAATLGFASNP